MKKILKEYDATKKMLNTLRSISSSQNKLNEQYLNYSSLKDNELHREKESENDVTNNGSDVDVINDVDVRLISDDNIDLQLSDEQRTEVSNLVDGFRSQVSQTANLEPGFTFTPKSIRMDGYIEEFDFKFHYIVGDGLGFYISGNMVRFENEALTLLEKLITFYEQVSSSLDNMLRERQTN
jgi:hypothetical protein